MLLIARILYSAHRFNSKNSASVNHPAWLWNGVGERLGAEVSKPVQLCSPERIADTSAVLMKGPSMTAETNIGVGLGIALAYLRVPRSGVRYDDRDPHERALSAAAAVTFEKWRRRASVDAAAAAMEAHLSALTGRLRQVRLSGH